VGWLVGIAVLVLVVIVALVYQRHGEAGAPSEDWTRTDEVFRDPSTGRLMRVWLDRGGERHYVPDGTPSGPAL
jgi:hypothetical protein